MKLTRILAAVLALCMALSASAFAAADDRTYSIGGITVTALADGAAPARAAERADITVGPEELAALGVETRAGDDGSLVIAVGPLLEALGADLSYDEGSGTLTVTDGTGALALLLALLGS